MGIRNKKFRKVKNFPNLPKDILKKGQKNKGGGAFSAPPPMDERVNEISFFLLNK